MAEFNETEHPREDDGKFTSKGTKPDHSMSEERESVAKRKWEGDSQSPNESKMHIQLFAAKIADQSERELRKSRKSLEKRIEEHKYKIAHPEDEYSDWNTFSDELKQKKLNWWRKEIKGFEQTLKQIDDRLRKG